MFIIFVSVFMIGVVLLIKLSSSSAKDVKQRIRKIVALCYLWNWKRRNGLMFKFEEYTNDISKYGLKSLPEAIMRENPRALTTHLNDIDSVGFQGTSNDGQAVIVRIVRHHDRCSEVVVYMRLTSGEEYQLPTHPDCLVYNTNGKTFSAGGLTLEVLEPLKRWRISFNGTLARINRQPKEDSFIEVQFNFIWKPMSDYVGFPHDYKSMILADQLAKHNSNTSDLLKTLSKLFNDEERFEQFGEWHGRVTIGANDEQTVLLRGIKERTNGIQNLNSIKSKISIKGVTKHGASFHLTEVITKTGQSLAYGYICGPCNMVIRHVCQWSADLNQLACEDQFRLYLTAGDRHYELQMTSEREAGHFHCCEGGNLQQEIRIFKLNLNGKDGYGFVETGYSSNTCDSSINRKSLPHLKEPDIKSTDRMVVTFQDVECRSSDIVGGKGSSLALMTSLTQSGWPFTIQFEVPQGLCVTSLAFKRHVKDHPEVRKEIKTLEKIVWKQMQGSMEQQCERLVRMVQDTVVSHGLKMQLKSTLKEIFGDVFESHKFAVRSSAIGEDGEELSAAGQNETYLGIKGLEEISSAIVKCWASQFSFRSIEYKRQNGQLLNGGMAVVVQKMVPGDVAGVLFSNHPVTGSRAYMLISSNYGLGESVVSGSTDPDSILLKRSWNDKVSILKKQVGEKKLKITMSDMNGISESEVDSELASKISVTDDMAIKLGQIAIYLEQSWGSARDIEWAIKEDKIYLLQSRPVTTESILTDFEVQHEFDSAHRTDNEAITKANIGEVLPRASTPLNISTLLRVISLSFQTKFTWKNRRHRYDPIVMEAVKVAYNHAFFNRMNEKFNDLSPKKSSVGKAIELSVYGAVLDDDDVLQQAIEKADGPPFMAHGKSYIELIKGLFFAKWFLNDSIKKFGQYPSMTLNANTIQEAYKDIDEKYMDVEKIVTRHHMTTYSSVIWNITIINCLAAGKDFTADQYTDFSKLTSGANDTESCAVPHSLKELAASIHNDIEPTMFTSMSTKDALKWLTQGRRPSTKKFNDFIERHGHRGYKELEVASKTWGMKPESLVKVLQEMLKNPVKTVNRESSNAQEVDVIDTLVTPLSPIKKKILRWVIGLSKIGIKRRELGKFLFVKVIDGARKGYWHLARLMVAEGMLPDENLLFYLTHEEIGTVIETRSAKLIRRAKQRQRMQLKLDKLEFPIIVSGIPEPNNLNEDEVDLHGLTQVTGSPVSQGIVQGLAKVIRNFDEVHTIKQGDILITQYTDIGWSPYFPMLVGIVTENGGLASHGAVVARELGLPCIVGAQNATRIFQSGETVLLNANKGILAKVEPRK